MALTNVKTYTGHGQAGVFSDPANWANNAAPGAADTALITQNLVVNGVAEVNNMMFLGAQTSAINGAVKTDSTNTCESFMVCNNANLTFNAGSSLMDAGGFEVGVLSVGTVNIAAGSASTAAPTLKMQDMKLGQATTGVGTLNMAGGSVSIANTARIGLLGQGTLNMSGGTYKAGALQLGMNNGAVGHVNLTGTAALSASVMMIGTKLVGGTGGAGQVSVGAGAALASDRIATIDAGSAVTMAGGAFNVGGLLQISQGGTVSGFGTVSAATHGVTDNGTLASSGGTLVVTGNLAGMGAVQVGANSTLDLVASKISVPSIAFLGAGATLELAAGVPATFSINGFAAGDQLMMNGIDHATWNGSTDVLSLSNHGQVIDSFTMNGVASTAAFTVTQGIGGSIIALAPSHH